MEKRGQATIFVIVGILIVVAVALIYSFYPRIRTVITGEIVPNDYLRECIKPSVDSGIETLSSQGGYAAPEGYILYKGKQIKYLCYTTQYYQPCTVQQPLLKQKFENELNNIIKKRAEECVVQMKTAFEKKGYTVSASENVQSSVKIVPENTRIKISSPMQITKESTQSFSDFDIDIPSKMYNLLMISTSIIDYESTYGDSSTDTFMAYYPNLIVEKTKLMDGSKIYAVSDVTTSEKFTFASRGLSWPGGYGLNI